ncbi:ArsR/SmtB family transcription factor [Halocatena halophila]|uniref:ArsR/SmtB family transcription factor n=1 Tax=Halocatena halophila TaxID=2814576 RepID=UPI002ED35054
MTDEKRFDPVAVRDAFSLLSDETRVQILLCLFDRDDPCTFSELRAHAGIEDSGRFNYHLGQLVGTFVRKQSGQGTTGYTLTYAGNRIVGSIASGSFTREVSIESQRLAASCVRCDTRLKLQYESEQLSVACCSCEYSLISAGVPPALIERTGHDDLPTTFERWARSSHGHVTNGFCWRCDGPVSTTLVDLDAIPDAFADLLPVELTCEWCGATYSSVVGGLVLGASPVIVFHYEHGIDIATTPLWELSWPFEPHAAIRSTDPLSIDVWIELDGDRLELVLDETFAIIESEPHL